MRNAFEYQQIGVDAVGIHVVVAVNCALGFHAQPVDLRILRGIGLQQHQFEQRFVGCVDALEQLPVRNAEKFLGRQHVQAAEVEPAAGPDKTFLGQMLGVLGVSVFLLGRHDPPKQRIAGQQDSRAVELFQQQGVLGVAAAFLGKSLHGPVPEGFGMHHEEMRMQADLGRAFLEQGSLAPQGLAAEFADLVAVAQPEVQVAAGGLAQAAHAAHQVQPEYGKFESMPFVFAESSRIATRQKQLLTIRTVADHAGGGVG